VPNATDHQLKRLDHLQTIIQRLAGNSFLIKGWANTLVSAILGFSFKDSRSSAIAYLALLPTLLFWALDAYYLALEEGVRILYNSGAEALAAANYPAEPQVALAPAISARAVASCDWVRAARKPATWLIYAALIVSILLAASGKIAPTRSAVSGI
jgi:hypothetical protein